MFGEFGPFWSASGQFVRRLPTLVRRRPILGDFAQVWQRRPMFVDLTHSSATWPNLGRILRSMLLRSRAVGHCECDVDQCRANSANSGALPAKFTHIWHHLWCDFNHLWEVLANSQYAWTKFVRSGPNLSNGPPPEEVGLARADFDRGSADFDRLWPVSTETAETWPNSTTSGRIPILPTLAQIWPTSTKLGRSGSRVGRFRPRHSSILCQMRPNQSWATSNQTWSALAFFVPFRPKLVQLG